MSSLDARRRAMAAQREGRVGHVPTQAKVLDDGEQYKKLVKSIKKHGGVHWQRDYAAFCLNFHAGLRPCEIARLEWARHVCGPTGEIADVLTLTSDISKKDHGRVIPLDKVLKASLHALRADRTEDRYVFYPANLKDPTNQRVGANAVSQFFKRAFARVGFAGCSAYSGRRTWITQKARQANKAGCSIRDVQIMAGHTSLATTAKYIEPSGAHRALVELPLFE
jgi:integrase